MRRPKIFSRMQWAAIKVRVKCSSGIHAAAVLGISAKAFSARIVRAMRKMSEAMLRHFCLVIGRASDRMRARPAVQLSTFDP